MPLHYVYRYGVWQSRPRPGLHLPPGGRGVLDTVAATWDRSVETFEATFDIEEYDPPPTCRSARCASRSRPAADLLLVKIDAPGVTYADHSADTAPTERLARFAHGADLFVCEAALRDAANDDSAERGHMDAAEAGREAAGPTSPGC